MVARRAGDWRGDQAKALPTQGCACADHSFDRIDMGDGIAHNAALTHPGAAHFELGLNQQQGLAAARGQEGPQGRQHQSQGNKGQIGHGQVGPRVLRAVEVVRSEVAQVGALAQHQARISAQAPGGLAVTHINAIDAASAVLKQAIAKAARGDAAIEADPPRNPDRQGLKGGHQLLTTPGDKAGRLLHL